MLTASEPWAGSYRINEQVWATAHFTQFTALGDRYLPHGAGTGKLAHGGSYVSLVDGRGGLTIVVQKASHEHSLCEYKQNNAPFNTSSEYATFQLRGNLTAIHSLQLWHSLLLFNGSESTLFEKRQDVAVGLDGKIRLHVLVDSIYTLTNRGATAQKGRHAGTTPLKPTPFPLPYQDDFESCQDSREAKYFSDFSGAFECQNGSMFQMTPTTPIGWMHDVSALSVIGSVQWEDISAAVDITFASSVSMVAFGCLGVRVSNRGAGSRGMTNPDGLFLSVQHDRGNNRTSWAVANQNVSGATVFSSAAASPGILASGVLPTAPESVRLNVSVVNNSLRVIIHGNGPMRQLLLDRSLHIGPGTAPASGWVGIGSSFARVGFDNVHIHAAPGGVISRCLTEPSVGQVPVTVACGSVEALDGMRWDMEPGRADGLVKLRAENTSLCLQAIPAVPPSTRGSVQLATCDRSNPRQHFLYDPAAALVALNYGGGSTISHIPAAGVAPQCLTQPFVARGTWSSTIVDPTAFSAVVLGTAACPQQPPLPPAPPQPPPSPGASCPATGWKPHAPNGYWSNAFPTNPHADKANATVALCAKKCAALANCLAFEVYTGYGRACYIFLDELTAPFSPLPKAITCVKVKAAEAPAATAMPDSAVAHPSLLRAVDPSVVALGLQGEEEVATAPPASLFTWSPTLGFLVNHACASGNLCIGVCGSGDGN